jgi:phosphomevalonate kinase
VLNVQAQQADALSRQLDEQRQYLARRKDYLQHRLSEVDQAEHELQRQRDYVAHRARQLDEALLDEGVLPQDETQHGVSVSVGPGVGCDDALIVDEQAGVDVFLDA